MKWCVDVDDTSGLLLIDNTHICTDDELGEFVQMCFANGADGVRVWPLKNEQHFTDEEAFIHWANQLGIP